MAHPRRFRVTLVTSMLFSSLLASVRAEDFVLDELYGSGVHAYFCSDYQTSVDLLSSAVGEGSTDPRVYYFRGLANLQMGLDDEAENDEAENDFETGARYEASKSGAYRVGLSLERIQGYNRHKLEKFRRDARIQARRQRILRDRLRYHSPDGGDSRLVPPDPTEIDDNRANDPFTDEAADRPAGTGPAEDTAGPPSADEPADAEVEEDDEFGAEEDAFGEDPEIDEPADAGDEPVDDPFGDEEMGGEEEDPFDGGDGDDDDPFGV